MALCGANLRRDILIFHKQAASRPLHETLSKTVANLQIIPHINPHKVYWARSASNRKELSKGARYYCAFSPLGGGELGELALIHAELAVSCDALL